MMLLMFHGFPLNCSAKEAIKLFNRNSLIAILLSNRGKAISSYQVIQQDTLLLHSTLCIGQYRK